MINDIMVPKNLSIYKCADTSATESALRLYHTTYTGNDRWLGLTAVAGKPIEILQVYRNTTMATPAPKIQPAGWCGS